MERDARIEKERKDLINKLGVSDFGRGQKKLAINLIERAAYMRVTLEDLEQTMLEKGMVEDYKHTASVGRKRSAECDVYLAMSKLYSTIIRQLEKMKPTDADGDDGFDDFLMNR